MLALAIKEILIKLMKEKFLNKIISGSPDVSNSIGFFLLGLLCCGYTIGGRRFAEWHIQLPSGGIPIFIGEIAMVLCAVLCCIQWQRNLSQVPVWVRLILGIYFLFVALKAILGFQQFGTLALRDSALFYYPVFVLYGFLFFKRELINDILRWIVLGAIALIFLNKVFLKTTIWNLMVFWIILFLSLKGQKILKWAVFVGALLILPYEKFLSPSRAVVIATMGSIFYSLVMIFLGYRQTKKILLAMVLIFFVGIAVRIPIERNNPNNKLFSLKLTNIKDSYQAYTADIHQKLKNYQPQEIRPQIFNKETVIDPSLKMDASQALKRANTESLPHSSVKNDQTKIDYVIIKIKLIDQLIFFYRLPESLKTGLIKGDIKTRRELSEGIQAYYGLETPEERFSILNRVRDDLKIFNEDEFWVLDKLILVRDRTQQVALETILFRVFIWQDMWDNLKAYRPVLGVEFGRPFRSKRLEVLNWGFGEWRRDGWIAMHNSFLNYIYRGGIVGVWVLVMIFGIIIFLSCCFVKSQSVSGILLVSILVYWLLLSLFGVILELPYNAIPFWSIMGITLQLAIIQKSSVTSKERSF